MDEETLNSRLSRISTIWSTLDKAQRDSGSEAHAARLDFLRRYQGAVYRYLLGAVKDPEEADDLFQRFVLRFMQGAFRGADRRRGRFRDYLKTALYRSVVDHFHHKRKRPLQLDSSVVQPAARSWGSEEAEEQFAQSWREELLARGWAALAKVSSRSGPPPYAVLKLRTENPHASSEDLARQLTAQLPTGRPVTPTNLRKAIERARNRFAELLIHELARSLDHPSHEELEQELIQLRLMPYCRTAFRRLRGDS